MAYGDALDLSELSLLLEEEDTFDQHLIFEDQMLKFFKAQLRRQPHAYCYIRCLDGEEDQETFMTTFVGNMYRGCKSLERRKGYLAAGGIPLAIWKKVLEACSPRLRHCYHLHRYAYLCESQGNRHISEYDSIYTVALGSYGPSTEPDVHILFTNNHLQRISESKVKPSAIVNEDFVVDGAFITAEPPPEGWWSLFNFCM
jgi:hypothetical protein